MKVFIEMASGFNTIPEAIEKNRKAMNWAIDNCPVQYATCMVDNKAILEAILKNYQYQSENKYNMPETGWVIERKDCPLCWNGKQPDGKQSHWGTSAMSVRFSREEDAWQCVDNQGFSRDYVRVTEHQWGPK